MKFLAFKVNHFQRVLLPLNMKLNSFQKTAITTVFATLFLILVGGLVRAAGAGLGCPDWPKCFGMWIPPTNIADLPSQFDASQFNVIKTWIEYVNRLVGAVIGLLIIATFLRSFKYRKSEPSVFYSSAVAFILVLFQGWLGGQVVATGLSEWLITVHMIVAMIIVNVLLYAAFKASENLIQLQIDRSLQKKLWNIGLVLLVLSTIQMVLGTQVREQIDVIKEVDSALVPPRSTWIGMLGEIFEIHRTFSWALVISGAYLGFILWKEEVVGQLKLVGIVNVVLIFAQVLIGVGLAYMDVPRVLQVLHLVGIALMICLQFLMLLMTRKNKTESV
ncbi:MAG TPA: heme A synthase [Balneola sp.]|nr:heme A synthase [Balneola sp.]HAH51839.1 heme A synthase [Balneola sp.]HAW80523.1 heme A synthase [Balneola sp.]HBZ37828.1 heme A synthase [Balneola sp.]